MKLLNSPFIKNGLTLSGGVALAQVVPFLFYPLLSRLFTAEEFGLLATLTSITGLLSVIGSGKYENGILVADTKKDAADLAMLSVVLSVGVMLVSWVLMQFVLCEHLERWLHEPNLGKWLFVCPLSAFFVVVFSVYNEWCVREKYFKALSVNKIVNSTAIVLSKALLGVVRIVPQGLVVGDMIGRGISAAGCAVRAWLRDGKTFRMVRLRDVGIAAVRHKDYPLYTMPGQFLNTIGQAISVFAIGFFFSQSEVGYYSMAEMIFAVPITIVGTAVRDVYRQRANEEFKQRGNCISSFDKVLRWMVIVSVVALLVFVWFLPWLMGLFLGEQWRISGVYAQWMAPMMVLSFIAGGTSGLFIVADKLKAFFWWQFYYAASTLVAFVLGGWLFKTMEATLIIFVVFRSSAYLISIILTRHYAKGVS